MTFVEQIKKRAAGSLSVGPVTVYGANAMHWAINIRTRWGTLCAHPTTRTFGGRWPWYLYLSENATPWAAVFAVGPGIDSYDLDKAWIRLGRILHGRSFNTAPGVEPSDVGLSGEDMAWRCQQAANG